MRRTYRSFAKINLHLAVLGRRTDGYHQLETLFQSVALADVISLESTGGGVALEVLEGSVSTGPDNLACRAAAVFLERWAPGRGVRLQLRKRIPVGGGLGGGSSNAAAVLTGLQEMLDVGADSDELSAMARELGADVPFFLVGGTAVGRSRGDRVEALPDLPEREIWLVTPPIGVSTAQAFARLGLRPGQQLRRPEPEVAGIGSGWDSVGGGRNDLEATILAGFPMVRDVYNVLVEAGATVVRLSGTGATVFACFEEEGHVFHGRGRLPAGTRVIRTRTLTRSSISSQRVASEEESRCR